MARAILLFCTILVVGLFLLGLSGGIAQGGRASLSDLDSPLVSALSAILVPRRALTVSDLTTRDRTCLVARQQIALDPGQICRFEISPNSTLRTGQFRLASGRTVGVELQDGDLSSLTTLRTGDRTSVTAGSSPLVVTLRCPLAPGSPDCIVALEP